MESKVDILVLGAGPAGSFFARQMAQKGLTVTVLEKNSQPKRKVCGEYLCPLGVKLLEENGLGAALVGQFEPIRGMLIVTSKGTEVPTVFPNANEYSGIAVNRKEFDQALIEVAQNAGAKFELGVTVMRVERAADRWRVITDQGTYNCKILIGADGRASVVSKSLNNDLAAKTRRVALHAFVNSKDINARHGEMHLFEDGSYIGINPTSESEINFSLVLDVEQLRSLGGPLNALNHYLKRSKNLSGRFSEFQPDAEISAAFPIHHKTKSIIPAHNVALIGDAAGFIDPLTGEGMYNALLSAQILSEQLSVALASGLVVPPDTFKNYETSYNRVLRQKSILNKVFQKIIRKPWVVELMAHFLLSKQNRADVFVGIIGNIYSPLNGLVKLML